MPKFLPSPCSSCKLVSDTVHKLINTKLGYLWTRLVTFNCVSLAERHNYAHHCHYQHKMMQQHVNMFLW